MLDLDLSIAHIEAKIKKLELKKNKDGFWKNDMRAYRQLLVSLKNLQKKKLT